jgi:hypothetical protein
MLVNLPGGRQTLQRIGPSLAKLESHAHSLAWAQVGKDSRALLKDPALLPEMHHPLQEIERRATRLLAWQKLRVLIGVGPWQTPPDAKAVSSWLTEVEKSAGKDATGSLRRYLACRAQLEGHTPLARSLEKTRDAKTLLRDLKGLAAKRPAAPPPPPSQTDSVLDLLLLPEAPTIGFRPAVREALGADLPALAAADKAARAEAVREVEGYARLDWNHASVHLARLAPYQRQPSSATPAQASVQPPTKTRDALTAEVSKLLARDLSPAEGVLARHLGQTREPVEVAKLLRKADAKKEGDK